MKLKECRRCGCSLDTGDEATEAEFGPVCVSCHLIENGADPWEAALEAANRKERATSTTTKESTP